MISDWTRGVTKLTSSGAERIAELAPEATVVKAFNHIYVHICPSTPSTDSLTACVHYCGDDDAAKAKVASLIVDAGFEPIDAGALKHARCLEPLAEQMLQFTHVISTGTDQALKITRR